MSTGYHHGNLPAVLREHEAARLAEQGLATFSLREVARRAGVSHAAPAHHFGSVGGLLTAVVGEIDARAAHRSALLWWPTVHGLTQLETSFASVST